MEGFGRTSLICLLLAALSDATITTKEVRTTALTDKILGGVIDIVHSHKNKPPAQGTQQSYPNQVYPTQYPQYQQWSNNGQTYQGQGFNYAGQYPNQGQYVNYNGYNQATYPPNNGNYPNGQTYPAPAGFSNGQSYGQGQYQVVYQNQPGTPQYVQSTQGGQYQNQQTNQYQGQNQGSFQGQNQPGSFQGQNQPGSFQGQNQPGSFQGQTQPTGSYGQRPSNNYQGPNGSYQGQDLNQNQHFQGSGGHQTNGTPGGPTCVCQAWTKPTDTLSDPAAEKIGNEPSE